VKIAGFIRASRFTPACASAIAWRFIPAGDRRGRFGYAPGEGKYWKFRKPESWRLYDVESGRTPRIDRGSLDDTRIAEA